MHCAEWRRETSGGEEVGVDPTINMFTISHTVETNTTESQSPMTSVRDLSSEVGLNTNFVYE
jgi:hypothetical protein